MKKIILGMLVLLGLGACGGDRSKNQSNYSGAWGRLVGGLTAWGVVG